MSQKRFTNVKKDIFQYGEWYCSAGGEHCAEVIATALNIVTEENEQLKKENEKLESLWEDKCIKEYMTFLGENALQEMHNEKYGDK